MQLATVMLCLIAGSGPEIDTSPIPPPAPDLLGDALPAEAVARLGTYRLRHGYGAASVAFSPDGKTVASVGNGDGHLWDVATGKELRPFTGHDSCLRSVEFSPDGKLLFAAGLFGHAIYFFDVGTGKRVQHVGELPCWREVIGVDDRNEVRSLAVFPDGKTIAQTGSPLRLWDVTTGKKLLEVESQPKGDLSVVIAVSPHGRTFVSGGGGDAALGLYDATNGKLLREFTRRDGRPRLERSFNEDEVLCAAVSPDSKTIASGGKDQLVRLWNTATGEEIRQMRKHQGSVLTLVFTPDGTGLLSASRDAIYLWEAATGKLLREFSGHQKWITAVAVSPDGKVLAATDQAGIVRIWEVATGKQRHAFEGHQNGVESLSYSPGEAECTGRPIKEMWADLGAEGAAIAYRAISEDSIDGPASPRMICLLEVLCRHRIPSRFGSPLWVVAAARTMGYS